MDGIPFHHLKLEAKTITMVFSFINIILLFLSPLDSTCRFLYSSTSLHFYCVVLNLSPITARATYYLSVSTIASSNPFFTLQTKVIFLKVKCNHVMFLLTALQGFPIAFRIKSSCHNKIFHRSFPSSHSVFSLAISLLFSLLYTVATTAPLLLGAFLLLSLLGLYLC